MKPRCAAMDGSKRCRSTIGLWKFYVRVKEAPGVILPEQVVVDLCPKHFFLERVISPKREQAKK